MSNQGAASLPAPQPPVVTWGGSCGAVIIATDNGSPSAPDPGGTVALFYDDGTGPVQVMAESVADWVAANPLQDVAAADGEYYVVQTGGGVTFSGTSGPSNNFVCP